MSVRERGEKRGVPPKTEKEGIEEGKSKEILGDALICAGVPSRGVAFLIWTWRRGEGAQ
jgi:hypothetical protein